MFLALQLFTYVLQNKISDLHLWKTIFMLAKNIDGHSTPTGQFFLKHFLLSSQCISHNPIAANSEQNVAKQSPTKIYSAVLPLQWPTSSRWTVVNHYLFLNCRFIIVSSTRFASRTGVGHCALVTTVHQCSGNQGPFMFIYPRTTELP